MIISDNLNTPQPKIIFMEPNADVLFEVSFEVCNKVGGIYNVLKSKAAQMVAKYRENYFAIGPCYPEKAVLEIVKQDPPEFMKNIFSEMENLGIICNYGKWLIEGRPNVILIDFKKYMEKANEIKKDLWEKYKVDSWDAKYDFDEPVVWSTTVGILIEKLLSFFKDKRVVCHFHEWLSGGGLLYLKDKVPTVFTTHATMLGRSIAGSGEDLYEEINEALKEGKTIESKRGYKYNVQAKHLLEKACAENCTIFSTVSEITSKEASYIHGKPADILLPNGFDISKFPTMEEFAVLHRKYREKIKDFLNAYFNPYYETNLWDAMIFFTSGRYEFRNKGFDVFIDALGKLNEEMIKKKIKRNVFAFFFVPKGKLNENPELLENIILYKDIEEQVIDEMSWIRESIINSLVKGKMPRIKNIFRKEFLEEYRIKMIVFRKKGDPPLCAFQVEGKDDILEAFKKNNLLNEKKNKVKVIFYPAYLTATDRLLSLDYEQTIQGSHLGIFPSYYEPWGYTPLDAAANGVLAITSDLAGLGKFIEPHLKGDSGIMVLKREGKTREEVVDELFKLLWKVTTMSRKQRIPLKSDAKELASLADWKILVKHYIEAHNLALEKFKM